MAPFRIKDWDNRTWTLVEGDVFLQLVDPTYLYCHFWDKVPLAGVRCRTVVPCIPGMDIGNLVFERTQ